MPYHRSEEHTSELQSHSHLVGRRIIRSEEHTSELQSHSHLVCRLLLEKKKDRVLVAAVAERKAAVTRGLVGDLVQLAFFFFLMIRRPPISTLFPYPTLFQSEHTSELQSHSHLVCRLLLGVQTCA